MASNPSLEPTPEEAEAIESMTCGTCHAAPGEPCRTGNGNGSATVTAFYHSGRFSWPSAHRLSWKQVRTPKDRGPGRPYERSTTTKGNALNVTVSSIVSLSAASVPVSAETAADLMEMLSKDNTPMGEGLVSRGAMLRRRLKVPADATTEQIIGAILDAGISSIAEKV
ncbi:hypothetical protein ACFV9E_09005 [Streptomyces sp. NPDC059835]|uniref:zinc finger domain-containing protein n=1 Tax=Streptomyces sp. NPDC059835 TaxID=3346967 RepID=UPI00364CFE81